MAIKKSELYSTLWESCNHLRGGMDASQYKDYVLVLLFLKYVSDRYADKPHALVDIPEGASFNDISKLKGKKDIGDKLNKIIAKVAEANNLKGVIDIADFNDPDKLGSGKEMQDRLSDLVAIFENPNLDFSKQRASDDDLLGDAYEYLMRQFATESGKSKGNFYTPAEVSRIMASVIGIKHTKDPSKTLYDPTCGSGSLLLKANDETKNGVSIYGQEMDNATFALAKMNMMLHGITTAEIWKGNTLASPHWTESGGGLKKFDFAVANPPFSYKRWRHGFNPENDIYKRFDGYSMPPKKNGDYAFLLHFIRSLKSTGKGAIILPHGVLFRGNTEAAIRKKLVRKGYIKGIIGLPSNLFYGTGIPACIIIIDKKNAGSRRGLFMVDASKGFVKDGNKNRLRERDIRKIVDVFNEQTEESKYSRMVPIKEVEENEYNLNIPRYINTQESEDLHDIESHLLGDIPNRDIEELQKYWQVYPSLRKVLFEESERDKYSRVKVATEDIKETIFSHPEFIGFSEKVHNILTKWKKRHTPFLKKLRPGMHPDEIISRLSDDIINKFDDVNLIDKYDIYQYLMSYWVETMKDDVYILMEDGWKAKLHKTKETKRKTEWDCDLVPKTLVIDNYFKDEKKNIEKIDSESEAYSQQLKELEEEHGGEDGILENLKSSAGNITLGNVKDRVLEIKSILLEDNDLPKDKKKLVKNIKKNFAAVDWEKGIEDEDDLFAEIDILYDYLTIHAAEKTKKKEGKKSKKELDEKVLIKYQELTSDEIKTMVVDQKWMMSIEKSITGEMDRVSQRLTQRIKELAERYNDPLPCIKEKVEQLSKKVDNHLEKMGFSY